MKAQFKNIDGVPERCIRDGVICGYREMFSRTARGGEDRTMCAYILCKKVERGCDADSCDKYTKEQQTDRGLESQSAFFGQRIKS